MKWPLTSGKNVSLVTKTGTKKLWIWIKSSPVDGFLSFKCLNDSLDTSISIGQKPDFLNLYISIYPSFYELEG